MLCCGYTLNNLPISIRLTTLTLWQSNDCPSASEATLMNMGKFIMWIDTERLYKNNKAKHNKTLLNLHVQLNCSLWFNETWVKHAPTFTGSIAMSSATNTQVRIYFVNEYSCHVFDISVPDWSWNPGHAQLRLFMFTNTMLPIQSTCLQVCLRLRELSKPLWYR